MLPLIKVGKVIKVETASEIRNPSYVIWMDFGGGEIKKTVAQVTQKNTPENLLGRKLIGLLEVEPRQIGKIMSEFLLLGVGDYEEGIILGDFDQAEVGDRLW